MFDRLPLATKIGGLAGINLLFLAIVAAVALVQMDKIGSEIQEIAEHDLPVLHELVLLETEQLKRMIELERTVTAALDDNDASQPASHERRFRELSTAVSGRIETIRSELKEAERAAHSDQARTEFAKLGEAVADIAPADAQLTDHAGDVFAAVAAGDVDGISRLIAEVDAEADELSEQIDASVQAILSFSERAAITAEADEQNALRLILGFSAIALLLGVGLSVVISRSITVSLRRATDDARSVSTQMLSSVQELSASVNETSSSVSQTMSTLDELRQTAEAASSKAGQLDERGDANLAAVNEALSSVERGVESMQQIRDQVESIAKNILELSEKNIQIGEMVESVNAIAEQSNLLAVNASIEAAKAGEHGKGFSVVANEVKALARQSQETTVQIRSILQEIQKSSNGAVMVTEQGSKRVEEGSQLITELGATIQALADAVDESAEVGRQIAMTASQQLAGVEQINGAMRDVDSAARDNATGATQLEQAGRHLDDMSNRLNALVEGGGAA